VTFLRSAITNRHDGVNAAGTAIFAIGNFVPGATERLPRNSSSWHARHKCDGRAEDPAGGADERRRDRRVQAEVIAASGYRG
jgi:hypothetical protein